MNTTENTSANDMSSDQINQEQLKVSQKNLVVAQRNRDDNFKAKEAQREQSEFDTATRKEDATFGLRKAWGQAGLTLVGLPLAAIRNQRTQSQVKSIMDGINQIFSTVTSIREQQRSLGLAKKQEERLGPTGTSSDNNGKQPSALPS